MASTVITFRYQLDVGLAGKRASRRSAGEMSSREAEATGGGANVPASASSVSEGSVQAANVTVHGNPAASGYYHKEREPDIPRLDGRDAKDYRT